MIIEVYFISTYDYNLLYNSYLIIEVYLTTTYVLYDYRSIFYEYLWIIWL